MATRPSTDQKELSSERGEISHRQHYTIYPLQSSPIISRYAVHCATLQPYYAVKCA